MSESVIHLKRSVDAVQIPSGTALHLPEGSPVIITQDLGGTYTVLLQNQAGLFRISAKDADALGKATAPASTPSDVATSGEVSEDSVWDQLKTCYDPEIPVNIVDLGLIYSLEIKPRDEGGNLVEVKMTLTAPGCGMGPVIASDAQHKIQGLPGVSEARVDVVWDPPWSSERISEEGRAKLGMV